LRLELTAAGVEFLAVRSGRLAEVTGLRGATVVSFCHTHLLHNLAEFRSLGCRVVWSPCMSYTTVDETKAFREAPPDVIHFQSRFQETRLRGDYEELGCRRFVRIPGVFEPLEYRPRPRTPDGFLVGRLARACRTKWRHDLWGILGDAKRRVPELRAWCQGWSQDLEQHLGPPPVWAKVFHSGVIATEDFLRRCHVLVCPNWCVAENWPRVGLEAMSAGVPLVVDDEGGWPEMVGLDAIRCVEASEYADAIASLGQDETKRMERAQDGRRRAMELYSPAAWAAAWQAIFRSLED